MMQQDKTRSLTESQISAILALPEHADAVIPTDESLQSAHVYTDPAHFEREYQKLLKRVPIPLTASAALPEPRMAYAHNDMGIPILLTRDADGIVHAFLNACTHRGAKIVDNGEPHNCARMTCPFHAWTFGLDGSLVALPKKEAFPTLDKKEYGLRRLPVREAGGIIWVGLDPEYEPDFSEATGAIAADFDAFGIGDMHFYGRRRFDLAANWKILIETFLETYHVPPLHRDTVAPHFAEVPTLMTHLGRNSRQTTGRSHFKRDNFEVDPDTLHRHVTHAYHLFPTAVLVTSPYHMNFITMMPRAADRTIADCIMLTKEEPKTEEAKRLFEKTIEFNFEKVFGAEDFHAAQLVQEGLSSGALKTVRFGGLEAALATMHRNIDEILAR